MWQDKKFIVIASLLVLLIAAVGTIGGILLARQGNDVRDEASRRVTVVLPENKNTPNLQESLDTYLDKLVKEGKITQQQADDFKAWLKDRPNIPEIFGQMSESMRNFGLMFGMGNK